jgi:lyso-ornithine lipid O-acyltransferase
MLFPCVHLKKRNFDSMIAGLRLCFVLVCFTLLTALLLPLQVTMAGFGRGRNRALPRFWHACMCKLLGFHVETNGVISNARPLMLVSNHVSWSDIFVLGAHAELSFIAKSEVEAWPVFGLLAKLQRTVFIDRKVRRKASEQSQEIAGRLKDGDVLLLFAEGTTSDGNRVLPFKTSLFGAAKMALNGDEPDAKVFIQPVSIAYTRCHAIPLGRYSRPVAAWPGTVSLLKHVKGVVAAGSISVDITFGVPLVFDQTTNRKRLAQAIEVNIRTMHQAALNK